eukprot:2119846-Pleurochrysis_carterae.AAC.1
MHSRLARCAAFPAPGTKRLRKSDNRRRCNKGPIGEGLGKNKAAWERTRCTRRNRVAWEGTKSHGKEQRPQFRVRTGEMARVRAGTVGARLECAVSMQERAGKVRGKTDETGETIRSGKRGGGMRWQTRKGEERVQEREAGVRTLKGDSIMSSAERRIDRRE